jgi:hypothetical protein
MVAANIPHKQCRTADKGWSSSLGVERGWLTIPYQVRNTLTMGSFEHGNEPFCSIKDEKFSDSLRHYQLPMDYAL